jgi:hypothetical protein
MQQGGNDRADQAIPLPEAGPYPSMILAAALQLTA